jgi:hypothetical protein
MTAVRREREKPYQCRVAVIGNRYLDTLLFGDKDEWCLLENFQENEVDSFAWPKNAPAFSA